MGPEFESPEDHQNYKAEVWTHCCSNLFVLIRTFKICESILELSSSSGSYPTFTYRFTTIGAGSDTISLDFVSDEITNDNIWTHDLTVADNDRITYLTVNTSTFEINEGISTTNKDFNSPVSLDGDAGAQILIETVNSNDHAKINSATISGSTLTLSCSGYKILFWETYKTTFYLVSSNDINGATVKSNLLTLNVT